MDFKNKNASGGKNDPPGYSPGGAFKPVITVEMVRSATFAEVPIDIPVVDDFLTKVGTNLGLVARKRSANAPGMGDVTIMTRRVGKMALFKQLVCSAPPGASDISAVYGGLASQPFMLPVGITTAFNFFGSVESDFGCYQVAGLRTEVATALLGAIGAGVEDYLGVNQQVRAGYLHLDLNIPNAMVHMLGYVCSQVSGYCANNPIRFAVPGIGTVCSLSGQGLNNGCEAFMSAFSGLSAFPGWIVELLRIGSLCEQLLAAGMPDGWNPGIVQAFNEVGVIVTCWDKAQIGMRVSDYMDRVQTPFCVVAEDVARIAEVRSVTNRGSLGQLVHRTHDDRGVVHAKIPEVDAELGLTFGSVRFGVRANQVSLKVLSKEGGSFGIDRWVRGMIKQ